MADFQSNEDVSCHADIVVIREISLDHNHVIPICSEDFILRFSCWLPIILSELPKIPI